MAVIEARLSDVLIHPFFYSVFLLIDLSHLTKIFAFSYMH